MIFSHKDKPIGNLRARWGSPYAYALGAKYTNVMQGTWENDEFTGERELTFGAKAMGTIGKFLDDIGAFENLETPSSNNCYEKGQWTKTGITTSNYDNEQEIKCLKNTYTHKIYSKNENSNYYVLKTIGYEIFKNYEEALNYVLKEELFCQCN